MAIITQSFDPLFLLKLAAPETLSALAASQSGQCNTPLCVVSGPIAIAT